MKTEKGFVLIASLVFLLALTVLGMTAMGTSTLQEKQANHYADRTVAINAADSALAACETIVLNWASLPIFDPDNGTDGLHLPSNDSNPIGEVNNPNWLTTDTILYEDLEAPLAEVKTQPLCIIEHLNTVTGLAPPVTKEYFRITARGTGLTNTSVIISQSIIERIF